MNLVFCYFVFVPAIVEDSIITSNRSDTQRFDVCKMLCGLNVCLDEYELFAQPRVAGHYSQQLN